MIIYILVGTPICVAVILLTYWRRRDRQTSKVKDPLGLVPVTIILSTLVASLPLHEIGHGIALYLLGIPFTIGFEILDVGPVLITKWQQPPSMILELAFAIIAGPALSAIICVILGRFWRTECYVAAAFQGCYLLFELSTWAFGVQTLNSLLIIPLFFIIVMVPFMIMTHKILNRMETEKK